METLLNLGYAGLFIGSFLAATVVPFSSDVVVVGMLSMGANPYITIIVATAGNWIGGLTSFWLGWMGKWEWLERYFHVKRSQLEKHHDLVVRYGAWLALLTWLPIVGDLMAIALGFYRVNFKQAAIFMLIGKGARFIMWAALYYWIFPR